LQGHCSVGAFVFKADWLATGWTLFCQANTGSPDRDYWLPLPSRGLQSFSTAEPNFADAVTMTRRCFTELVLYQSVPLGNGAFRYYEATDSNGDTVALFAPGFHLFWREHGDRSTLVTWAHVLGYSKETRDTLGRWSAQGSDEYIRAA
jgi:hypothetical protein